MSIEQCAEETKLRIAAWESVGQHEHAKALRAQMWALLGPFLRGNV